MLFPHFKKLSPHSDSNWTIVCWNRTVHFLNGTVYLNIVELLIFSDNTAQENHHLKLSPTTHMRHVACCFMLKTVKKPWSCRRFSVKLYCISTTHCFLNQLELIQWAQFVYYWGCKVCEAVQIVFLHSLVLTECFKTVTAEEFEKV